MPRLSETWIPPPALKQPTNVEECCLTGESSSCSLLVTVHDRGYLVAHEAISCTLGKPRSPCADYRLASQEISGPEKGSGREKSERKREIGSQCFYAWGWTEPHWVMVGIKMAASVEGGLLGGPELCVAPRTGICSLNPVASLLRSWARSYQL